MIYFWLILGVGVMAYTALRKKLRPRERAIRDRPTQLDRFAAENLRDRLRSDREADQLRRDAKPR